MHDRQFTEDPGPMNDNQRAYDEREAARIRADRERMEAKTDA